MEGEVTSVSLNAPARPGRTAALLLMAALGLGAFAVAGVAALGLGVDWLGQQSLPPNLTLPIFALVAAGAGLGLPLAWHSVTGLRGRASPRFGASPVLAVGLCLAYVASVVLGRAAIHSTQTTALTLPPLHVIALSVPAFLMLWAAAALAKDAGLTWRQAVGALGSGAFGATSLAFVAEVVLLVIGVVIAALFMGASPEWTERLRQLQRQPALVQNPQFLSEVLRQPGIIVTLVVGLGVVVPLVEEPFKSLVPALAGFTLPMTPARGFLLGVASGAGFAALEGMLNGGLSIQDWASVAVLRIGSTAMHCFASGLIGWGWGHAWRHRRWLALGLTYAVACAMHGGWNAISVGLGVVGAVLDPGGLQTTLVVASEAALLALSVGAGAALLVMANKMDRIGGAA